MISITDASELIEANTPAPRTERVPLQNAHHRVLAGDMSVPELYPAFTRSLMDGYAVSSQATASTSLNDKVILRVVETLTAGQNSSLQIASDQAVRIMTGAMLPGGCDCVVPQELAASVPDQPDTIQIPASARRPGASVLFEGALGRPGDPLLTAGTLLQPRHIAALAEFGITDIPVARIPSAAIISTGSELVPYQQSPPPGRLRNSSQPMLAALLHTMGARVVSVQSAADSPAELDAAIQTGLQADLLLLTGGVSVGLLDLVPAALRRAGVQQLLHGVRLKPGKPLWAGVHHSSSDSRSTLVFGLPGNPVSSLACCELFVRPSIRRLLGRPPAAPLAALLNHDFSLRGDRPVCQPAVASLQHSQLTVSIVPWQLSADLRSTAAANCMVLIEPSQSPLAVGSPVRTWLWDDQIS
ncbi:MAG: Molybdopterin molybdenumtransferase [Planctomycetota bacterium]|jgi:molybdopterin molybdotransferase